jgi:hypothetical protein
MCPLQLPYLPEKGDRLLIESLWVANIAVHNLQSRRNNVLDCLYSNVSSLFAFSFHPSHPAPPFAFSLVSSVYSPYERQMTQLDTKRRDHLNSAGPPELLDHKAITDEPLIQVPDFCGFQGTILNDWKNECPESLLKLNERPSWETTTPLLKCICHSPLLRIHGIAIINN